MLEKLKYSIRAVIFVNKRLSHSHGIIYGPVSNILCYMYIRGK